VFWKEVTQAGGGIDGRIVVKGWRKSPQLKAEEVLHSLGPYCSGFLCTYVDKKGVMQGTDLDWFRRLRAVPPLELTAAGGITTMEEVRTLLAMNGHAVLGMAIYTGRLKLEELAGLN
jgi:phosphoribosylformimino-5-aminoimidazole carboxamide ribonucleotide (ProFAR) isomerase